MTHNPEISPAMEEAGVAAYYAVDTRVADIGYLVREIYRAMEAAKESCGEGV